MNVPLLQAMKAALMLVIVGACGCKPAPRIELKTARYPDGVVEFRIPARWQDCSTKEGLAFEDSARSIRFEAKVVTVRSAMPLTTSSAADALAAMPVAEKGRIENVGNGNALVRYTEHRSAEQTTVTYWHVTNPIPPEHVRIAAFSCSIPKAAETDPAFAQELKAIDSEIRQARFAPEIRPSERSSSE